MDTSGMPVVVGIGDKQTTAIRFALREAHRKGTGLRVVHSAGLPAQTVAGYAGAEIFEDLQEAGQKVLDDSQHFIEQEVTPVPVTYVLTTAAPIAALEAEACEASTMVIGADNISWPDRLLGGAIASYVALNAACPVVVVPERAYPTPLSGGVVIALDGDTPASGPLQYAFEQAAARGHALHVLHAIPPATTAADAETIRANIGEVLAGWSGAYPSVRVLWSFPIDEADDACARATQRSELVVVGRPHRHALPLALARPLAADVLRHAHGPVAVVPADYRGA
jgi:nucleotide-binding universal stress UspA family protein